MVVENFDDLGEAGLKACLRGRLQDVSIVDEITQSNQNSLSGGPVRDGPSYRALWGARCGYVGGRGTAFHFPRMQPRRVDQSHGASIWQLVDLFRCVRVDHDVPCQDRGHQESEAHRVRLQRWWSLMPNCRLFQGPIGNAFEPIVFFQRVCAARCGVDVEVVV